MCALIVLFSKLNDQCEHQIIRGAMSTETRAYCRLHLHELFQASADECPPQAGFLSRQRPQQTSHGSRPDICNGKRPEIFQGPGNKCACQEVPKEGRVSRNTTI